MEERNKSEGAKAKITRHFNFGSAAKLPVHGILLRLLVLAAIFTLLPSVSSIQLPVPLESTVATGDFSYSQVSSDIIGDRGSWTRVAFADLDADGDYDMLVGENDGMIEYWKNTGNNTDPTWFLENSNLVGDSGDHSVPTVIDFDKDGDFDILTGMGDGWLRYYKNVGTPTNPSFIYYRALWDAGSMSAPAFVDYNKDGNYDVVYGRDNRFIYYYKNDVQETGIFFDDFEMDDVGSYSTPAFVDLDDDGDHDLVVGNSAGQVYYYENIGTASSALWKEEELIVDVGDYAAPYLADFDNDADFDMVVGKSDGTAVYYRNDGTTTTPLWTLVAGFYTYDVGDYAAPAAADIDNDGDLDLFVGNSAGVIAYYENIGTPESPSFTLITTGLIPDVGDWARPHLQDMDSDGDYDMMIGRSDGYILYYLNDGNATSYNFISGPNIIGDSYDYAAPTAADIDNDNELDIAYGTGGDQGWVVFRKNNGNSTNFSFETKRTWWFDNWQRGASHEFVDFDYDNDLDLVVGGENGLVYYWRNDGSTAEPNYVYVRYWNDIGSWSAPALADMDNDNDLDLVVGRSDDPYLNYYENDARNSSFDFELSTANYQIGDIGSYSTTAFADIDDDGDLDMFAGRDNGYIYYYRNDGAPDFANFTLANSNLVGDYGDYSSMDFGDIDNDGDLDLFVGYSSSAYVYYFRNDGNETDMNFTYVTSNFLGGYCYNGNSNGWADPNLADIDADGDLDMLCSNYYLGPYLWRNDGGPDVPSWNPVGTVIGDPGDRQSFDVVDMDSDGDYDIIFSERNGNTYYYKNLGTPQSYSFTYIYAGNGGNQWIPNLGGSTYPSPTLADLDGDSDMDVVLGKGDGMLNYYENHGIFDTNEELGNNPTWIHRSSNWLGDYCHPGSYNRYCTPEFGDLDNDGDYDLISGNLYGSIYAWRNDGTPENPSWTAWHQVRGDWFDYTDPALGDIDNDGDLDVITGMYDGYIQLYKNVGNAGSPSWQYIQAGGSGYQWYPDQGTWVYVDLFDYDEDGLMDMSYQNDIGDFSMLKNKGIWQTEQQKADNPTWVYGGTIIDVFGDNNYVYNVPAFGDIDGDGDFDLLLGTRWGGIYLWKNDGSLNEPSWTYDSLLADVGDWGAPGLVDIDGDKDLDLLTGEVDGFVEYWRNTGDYSLATLLTLKDSGGSPVVNATAEFSDASGVVCTESTDSKGQAKCNITYVGDSGTIVVTNTVPGTVNVLITSPNSQGSSFMTLENPSSNFKLDVERFVFNTFSEDYQPNTILVEVSDNNNVVASKPTSNGYLDVFLPKKYLKNMQEPFTQNRIMYDIKFHENEDYASPLELADVYIPNEVNISSDVESRKLYKFLATHEMSTDAEYYGYVIYPALKAQRNYNLTDSVSAFFRYVGSISAEYIGNSCSLNVSNQTSYNINYQSAGCSFMGVGVQDDADWLKFRFRVRTPSLDTFMTNNWTTQDYQMPAASLSLVS